MTKTALITGVTGQDGAYLARLLLEKGYRVHGIKRRSSSFNTGRIDDIYEDPHVPSPQLTLHYGDLTDATNLIRIVQEVPQRETTPFYPRSPYAAAKLYAYWITVNYREAYGMHTSNGILFNHESPLRGETFVTRKITRAAAAISLGRQDVLYLGNLDAQRDWGHAREYVEGMWRMVQQERGDDYVLATGVTTTVRQFVEWAFADAGIVLEWRGSGVDEQGFCAKTGALRVAVDPRYFRPTEVDLLIGDASKARDKLGWSPTVPVRELVREMVEADLLTMRSAPIGRGS